nr:unnamed protein product [Digitaria exilis]
MESSSGVGDADADVFLSKRISFRAMVSSLTTNGRAEETMEPPATEKRSDSGRRTTLTALTMTTTMRKVTAAATV